MPAFEVSRGASPIKIIRKTTDQTLTQSNTTLQDVSELKLSLAVNEVWEIEAILLLSGSSTNADFKIAWTGPNGATATWSNESGANSAWVNQTTANSPPAMKAITDSVSIGADAVTFGARFRGIFAADSSHAGTIQLQAAQASATAENNKVLTNSLLRAMKLA